MIMRSARLAFALFVTLLALPAAAQEPIGIVTAQVRLVTAVAAEGARALHLGAPVFVDDVIVTQGGARCRIEFTDRSTLAIGQASRVGLHRFAPERADDAGILVELAIGIVRAVIGVPSPASFVVRTNAAVAAARSTDFIVEALPESAAVFVAQGAVEVSSRVADLAVVLQEGEGIDVPLEGAPGEVKRWGRARIDEALARTDVGESRQ